ncbi:MAG TPA: LssY C-terminal domain-containing protein, partial [Bradyrhizobium sp.]|nr:LssY C-terminal domain-containing protein [Bradyrhizobium sp.]
MERVLLSLLAIVLAYAALAYLVLPAFWTHYEHQKGLASLPMVTRTAQGIPGDAINAGLIGNEKEVLCAMNAARWFPADRVTFRSSIEIAGSVLLDRAYPDAPVSPLFYLGRH